MTDPAVKGSLLPAGQERKSSIPGMWAVPAEVSAKEGRGPAKDRSHWALGGAVAALVLSLGAFVARERGWIFSEADRPSTASTAPAAEAAQTQTGGVSSSAASKGAPPGGHDARGVRDATEVSSGAAIGLAVEGAAAHTDASEVGPVVAGAQALEPPSASQSGAEATSEPPPAPSLLTELPARRKARRLSERAAKLLLRGQEARAKGLLADALRLDPTYPQAWRDMGIARARLGDTEGAREAYERYLDLAPDAPDAPDVRRILGQ